MTGKEELPSETVNPLARITKEEIIIGICCSYHLNLCVKKRGKSKITYAQFLSDKEAESTSKQGALGEGKKGGKKDKVSDKYKIEKC